MYILTLIRIKIGLLEIIVFRWIKGRTSSLIKISCARAFYEENNCRAFHALGDTFRNVLISKCAIAETNLPQFRLVNASHKCYTLSNSIRPDYISHIKFINNIAYPYFVFCLMQIKKISCSLNALSLGVLHYGAANDFFFLLEISI